MNLSLWNPTRFGRELARGDFFGPFRQEMERTFNRFFGEGGLPAEFFTSRSGEWAPLIDYADDAREFTIRAEIPGVDPKDVNISVSGRTLTLSGEKSKTTEKKEGGSYYSERFFGAFSRSMELPETADLDHVAAEQNNGVITIRIPKRKGAEPKRIEVKTAK
jgi:HSP20 family protein